jgi:hypothetical protein
VKLLCKYRCGGGILWVFYCDLFCKLKKVVFKVFFFRLHTVRYFHFSWITSTCFCFAFCCLKTFSIQFSHFLEFSYQLFWRYHIHATFMIQFTLNLSSDLEFQELKSDFNFSLCPQHKTRKFSTKTSDQKSSKL